MKKVSKKEIRNNVETVMHQTLFTLQVAPTKKIKKMIEDAAKKFTAEIKRELKRQTKKETKAAKKQITASPKATKKKNKTGS
jgi:hypothetical protein